MRVIKKFEMRTLKHGCGVVAQNFLLNYSLFKITLNPSKKVEFSSEKQKDMSDDGSLWSTGSQLLTRPPLVIIENCRFKVQKPLP